jgi:hypothetical protein
MTTSASVWMLSLVNTMSTHQQEKLNVVERSACNCSHPAWKPTSHAMATKVSWITSWIPMRSLPWMLECKKWIATRLMGSVHMHWRILAIEGWRNPNYVWNTMKKIGEDNWKARKTNQVINQMLGPRPKHDKIWTQWVWIKYSIGEHVGKGMMMQTFWDGILKSNHLLPNEMFKWRKRSVN